VEIELKIAAVTEKQREINLLTAQNARINSLYEKVSEELRESENKLQRLSQGAKEKEDSLTKELALYQEKEKQLQEEKLQLQV
jgi:hypothetical protein